jgi:hypothetical protein
VLSEEGLGLVASMSRLDTATFSVRDGSLMEVTSTRLMWFSEWSIVVPNRDGTWNELCAIKAALNPKE